MMEKALHVIFVFIVMDGQNATCFNNWLRSSQLREDIYGIDIVHYGRSATEYSKCTSNHLIRGYVMQIVVVVSIAVTSLHFPLMFDEPCA